MQALENNVLQPAMPSCWNEATKPHKFCPGCGHGMILKVLGEAIDELGIKDQMVFGCDIGCSLLSWDFFSIDTVQTHHGRTTPVITGMKRAKPEIIGVAYMGDGGGYAIGSQHLFNAAVRNENITIILCNNCNYGMTGGQMAPTTLMGMKTATSPAGRTPLMGQPLRMAEMIAGLQGPVYVERVALYDAKQRTRAKRAIRKALECQVENKGFSFVEVLAECPTHLRLDPVATEKWVAEQMTQIFPLGLMKDVTKDASFPALPRPSFSEERLLEVVGASMEEVSRFATSFPSHLAKGDVALKLAGAGGDGAQTAAMLITNAAINEGFDSTHIPSYGPESRGGTSYADVHVAEREVLSPAAPNPHLLVAFNAPSLAKFGPAVQPGGVVVYDSSTIHSVPELPAGVTAHGVPFTQIAADLGRTLVKNVVALGALQEATQLFPKETFLYAIRNALKEKCAMIPLNEEAFAWGARAVRGN